MEIILRLDERDQSMVLLYVGEYLLGAAHVDCFEGLETPVDDSGVYSSIRKLLQEFTEIETELKIVNPDSYKLEE